MDKEFRRLFLVAKIVCHQKVVFFWNKLVFLLLYLSVKKVINNKDGSKCWDYDDHAGGGGALICKMRTAPLVEPESIPTLSTLTSPTQIANKP